MSTIGFGERLKHADALLCFRQTPLTPTSPSALPHAAAMAHHEDMLTMLITPAKISSVQAEILGFDIVIRLPEGPLDDHDVLEALKQAYSFIL